MAASAQFPWPMTGPETAHDGQGVEVPDSKTLSEQRSESDWRLADYVVEQCEAAGPQVIGSLSSQSGVAPVTLRRYAKVARAYPPGSRDPGLSFAHYLAVSNLGRGDASVVLADARARGLNDQQTRTAAVRLKALHHAMPRDDPEYDELMAIVRAWNRARGGAREAFADLMAETPHGVIEA